MDFSEEDLSEYKVIGSGFIFRKDELLFRFTERYGDFRKLMASLGAEGAEQKWLDFLHEHGERA